MWGVFEKEGKKESKLRMGLVLLFLWGAVDEFTVQLFAKLQHLFHCSFMQ